MRIPDLISPIVAYRTWVWEPEGLKSLNGQLWIPGEALEAKCLGVFTYASLAAAESDYIHLKKDVPEDNCTCGVYAAKDFKHLVKIGYVEYGIHGEVSLWGKVCDHELGYRAQYAYPKSFMIPQELLPFRVSELESRINNLSLYGADIFFSEKPATPIAKSTKLWDKNEGIQAEGFQKLMDFKSMWYKSRVANLCLEVEDRVSVKGMGIGIVKHIENDIAFVMLWNRIIMEIPVNRIEWDERNYRWTSYSSYSYSGVKHGQ